MSTTSGVDWDRRFLDLALHIARWSKDPSTRVGAVITDAKRRIVSVGYNGEPHGVSPAVTREQKLARTIHAENNAILFAQRNLTGCTLYCTHPMCGPCMALAVQAGIKRVVYIVDDSDFTLRWAESMAESSAIALDAGVEYVAWS